MFADLAACAPRLASLNSRVLATPLMLPVDEFRRSLDAFPIEYGAMLARYVVLEGADPFVGVAIRSDDLRGACEVQAKSHLIHLREGYLEAGGKRAAVARLVAASAPAFLALLAHVVRLEGREPSDAPSLVHDIETLVGISSRIVRQILDLRGLDRPPDTAADLYADCLAAAEQVARYVDTWTR